MPLLYHKILCLAILNPTNKARKQHVLDIKKIRLGGGGRKLAWGGGSVGTPSRKSDCAVVGMASARTPQIQDYSFFTSVVGLADFRLILSSKIAFVISGLLSNFSNKGEISLKKFLYSLTSFSCSINLSSSSEY